MTNVVKNIKLTAQERQNLRWALRSHSKILEQVGTLSQISAMDKASLLKTAEALGINIETAKSGVPLHNRPDFDTDEALALMCRSDEKPAFSGFIEQPLTFVLAGVSATRILRVTYEMTPEWPYFDTELGTEILGWPQDSMNFELLVSREVRTLQPHGKGKTRQRKGKGKTDWVNCTELFMQEVLGTDFNDVIDDKVEEACLRENEARKQAFQVAVEVSSLDLET